jgi:putative ABC transport system substrate-binding protein
MAAISSRSVFAQKISKRPLIAWLSSATQAYSAGNIAVFLKGMEGVGYKEGTDFEMAYRFSDGYQERLPALAKELVALNPNLILATAIVGAVAAKQVTSTVPIVSPALADAVELGLIASEARPGGNVTGIEPYVPGLPAKQMELALEIVPGAKRVGLLSNLKDQKAPPQVKELEAAGQKFGLTIAIADTASPDDIDSAFQALIQQQADVAIVLQTSMLLSQSQRIAADALSQRLPTVYGYREHVVAGG